MGVYKIEQERALYEVKEFLTSVIANAPYGIIAFDLEGELIMTNALAVEYLGKKMSANRAMGKNMVGLTKNIPLLAATVKDCIEKGRKPFDLPPVRIKKRFTLIKGRPMSSGTILTIEDITVKKKAEAELEERTKELSEANIKLKELDKMKTEFFSTAAHQLRTPLTSIQGFSEILMTRDNIKEKEKKEFISYINKQAVNLASIINDLLDISRIESGIGFTLHKVPCNINEIIKETVKYFQASYPERQFDIILPKEPVEVEVDKDKIGQVLENLLSNAVKYSPEGGSICLTAKKISKFAIEISVADHGIGMSPDQIKQIFDKFYRADASNSAIPGTGLGMSIVKNYVEAHGGKVWVESELRKGTKVIFIIPGL